jgi:hypothetical protein
LQATWKTKITDIGILIKKFYGIYINSILIIGTTQYRCTAHNYPATDVTPAKENK